MTPLPLLLVAVVASVPGAHCASYDQPDISSSSSSYLYDTDSEGLGQTEYHEGAEDEEASDDLEEGEDEDDMGYLLVSQPRKKLDPSFYRSDARERLLLNPHGHEQEESRRLMKRSREKTVKQLIRLCRNTNGEEPELAHLQGMLGRLRSKAEYMKRFGPAMLEQKRSRSMMKEAKVPSMKRSTMVKLKRMLTECLMEKNILEGRGGGGGGGRKPTTQFLRFGRGG